MSKFLSALTSVMIFIGAPAFAKDKPSFIFPVKCTLNSDCWVAQYVDMNPAADQFEDFTCGPRSYDNHKGTDFAIKDRQVMRRGVDVLAAADGTIERLRDGQDDTIKSEAQYQDIKDKRKECGNGVFIDHGAAVKTVYCHMKKGSVSVKIGDKVTAGDKIGEIGQSGYAEFPHLHFGIIWENGVIDPYSGMTNQDGCGLNKGSLWAEPDTMTYEPFSIYDAGFRDQVPNFQAIQEGEGNPKLLSTTGNALVLWGAFFGLREKDQITLTILNPQGRKFSEQNLVQDKTRTRQYYYTGRTLKGKTMPAGLYTGIIQVNRAGKKPKTRTITVDLK